MNPKTLGPMNPRSAKQMNPRPQQGMQQQQVQPVRSSVNAGVRSRSVQPSAPVKKIDTVRQDNAQQGSVSGHTAGVQGSSAAMPNSIEGIVAMMKKMVVNFAYLNDEVIEQNLKLANGQGMLSDDRTISFECVDYLFTNMSFILTGLVLDTRFKQAFLDAVVLEMQIDSKSPDEKVRIRKSMTDPKTYPSVGSVVVGFTMFTPSIHAMLMSRMSDGFDLMEPFVGEFDAEVAGLPDDRKTEYGFIFSNFMYLLRAFSHNDMFMSYVITVIEKVKEIALKKKDPS